MLFSKLVTLRMVLVGLPLATAAPAAATSFTPIDFPNSTATVALDINASGEIVGRYTSGLDGLEHGFLRSRHGKLMSVDYPGANFTVAAGINDRGDIVGQYRLPTDATMSRRGFMLRRGRFNEIHPPSALFTNVLGIGPSGDAVGRYCSMLPCTSDSVYVHGFLYARGRYTTIDVPGSLGTNAWKITPQGKVLGGYTDSAGAKHIFLLTHDGFTNIDVPGASIGVDNGAVNTHGEIVGLYCDSEPCTSRSLDTHGFLINLIESRSIDVPGATSTVVFSINTRGAIVGLYLDTSGKAHGFVRGARGVRRDGPAGNRE